MTTGTTLLDDKTGDNISATGEEHENLFIS